jgi:hypothetical protein
MEKKIMAILYYPLIGLIPLFAQENITKQSIFPAGISVEYGKGQYSVRDEYISREKYSGTIPFYKVQWSRHHLNYNYLLELSYQNSSEIKNNNISAKIYQFLLSQSFLYPVSIHNIFSRDLYTFIGPMTEFYFYYNKPEIAVSGFDYAQSAAGLFSLGLSIHTVYPLYDKLKLEGIFKLSVLSMGIRLIDSEEEDVSPVKLLSLLAGTHASLNAGVRYSITENFSVKAAYQFQLTRITSWDPLLSASDNILLTITCGF